MAIDTAAKRASALGFGTSVQYIPNGGVDTSNDRATVLELYNGLGSTPAAQLGGTNRRRRLAGIRMAIEYANIKIPFQMPGETIL